MENGNLTGANLHSDNGFHPLKQALNVLFHSSAIGWVSWIGGESPRVGPPAGGNLGDKHEQSRGNIHLPG